MSRIRHGITDGKLPQRVCPVHGTQVIKIVKYGQLSYECGDHWGPWNEAIKVVPIPPEEFVLLDDKGRPV